MKWMIGIDEAGRGPLAGPVAVGVAMVPVNFDWTLLPGVTDSKKLSEKKREEIFKAAGHLVKEGKIDLVVSMSGPQIIDRVGITTAVNRSISRALVRLEKNTTVERSKRSVRLEEESFKLDGGLRAPERFADQETIIKGDQKERIIGLASIAAKVTRDRYMVKLSNTKCWTVYGFEKHKGYGTKAHREAILEHGCSSLHRATYCRFYTEK